MLRIGFIGPLAASFSEAVKQRMTEPFEFVFATEKDVVQKIRDLDVLVTLVFTAEMASAARRLRLVQVPGAGLDRIDQSALPAKCGLANAYGHEDGIAEYVLGAMLTLRRNLLAVDAALRRGIWDSQWAVGTPPPPVAEELSQKTVALLGYGRIGQAVGKRVRALGMRVCAIRRDLGKSIDENLALLRGLDGLHEVLGHSDYVVSTLPLSKETADLIDESAFKAMKRNAILVNVGRAGVVNEDALYTALRDRTIAAAAIDVWYRYPTNPGPALPANRPFHELPNVLMTPHIAGWTEGMMNDRASVIAENVTRLLNGEMLVNEIRSPKAA